MEKFLDTLVVHGGPCRRRVHRPRGMLSAGMLSPRLAFASNWHEYETVVGQFEKDKRMKTRMHTLIHRSSRRILQLVLLSSLTIGAVVIAADDGHASHANTVPAKLVQTVRDATRQFVNVNAATAAGYQPFLGCVSGPDHGAMGFHYVNGPLVADGLIDATKPEALIYEASDGGLKLVGVEFVVLADTWLAHNSSPPVLDGQSFQYVGSPNRYNLPAHFELHVWAWRDNPNGAFVDWNNDVSCEGQ